ncbi:hypothetical protein AB0D94_34835 [Streptomyces sp. NPDC048255]
MPGGPLPAGPVDRGDLVFTTIGSLTENSDNGDHHAAAGLFPDTP